MKFQRIVINKNLKGFSIVELLISLIIISFLFTSFLGLASASLKMAKNNEIEDVSMTVLLKAKDLLRGSNDLTIATDPGGTAFESAVDSGIYLTMDDTGQKLIPSNINTIISDDALNCVNTNHEWISTAIGNPGYTVCVQIYMKKKTNLAGYCYGIKVVSEKSSDNVFVERLYGFRIGTINIDSSISGVGTFGTANAAPDQIKAFCN